MPGSVLFGVVGGGEADPGLVAYLKEPQPVTPDVAALTSPLPATAVFRFAAECVESACAHFDGARCTLAGRIVDLLPPVVDVLPACAVRSRCRWWHEQGRAACGRCPVVATDPVAPGEAVRQAAAPPTGAAPS